MKEESREDILWIKPDTPGYKLASSNMHHSLILLDVKKKYSGAYTCIATNKAGQSICTATLEVADGKSLLRHRRVLCVAFYTAPQRKRNRADKEINQTTTEKKAFSQAGP